MLLILFQEEVQKMFPHASDQDGAKLEVTEM